MQVVAVCYELSDSKEQFLSFTATALQRTIGRLGRIQCGLQDKRTGIAKQTLEFVCSVVNMEFFVREETQISSSQQKNNPYGFYISSGRTQTFPTLILCVFVLEQNALAQ